MLDADYLPSFVRDRKRLKKKHWPIEELDKAIVSVIFADEMPIPLFYNDHALKGDLRGYRLLHVGGRNSDWLLLYKSLDGFVTLIRTGSHDDIL